MSRGILATCYARPATSVSTEALLAALAACYEQEPFVAVRHTVPSTKATLGSNAAHLTARFDPRTGYVMVLCAIDNLTKGASGGAVQAANVALGLCRDRGLSNGRDSCREPPAPDVAGRTAGSGPDEKAAVLVEALPYIRRFAGQRGGGQVRRQRAGGWQRGRRPGSVRAGHRAHARGGDAAGGRAWRWAADQRADGRLGKVPEFRNGLRVTDAETIDIARMVLRGQVNPRLVAAINVHGPLAVGVSGEDAGLISATPGHPDLGLRRPGRRREPGDPAAAAATRT